MTGKIDLEEQRGLFHRWYVTPLEKLYSDDDAGFVIMQATIPLIERYISNKHGIKFLRYDNTQLHIELHAMFPALVAPILSQDFWDAVRNGLFHEATFKPRGRNGLSVFFFRSTDGIQIRGDGIYVNPPNFSKAAIKAILGDFKTYAGTHTAEALPVIHGDASSSGPTSHDYLSVHVTGAPEWPTERPKLALTTGRRATPN